MFILERNETIVKICDNHVTFQGAELLFCKTSLNELKWFTKFDCPETMYRDYCKQFQQPQGFSECNTDKTVTNFGRLDLSCVNKTKTKGVVLAVFNCGIILGYRELFGAESCTQVCLFYLDILTAYAGKLIRPKIVNNNILFYFNFSI